MTTTEQIKAECRAIIALAEKATPGPWYYWDQPSNDLISTGEKQGHLICGLAGLKSMPNEFKLIAASRSFTPQAARALLGAIEMFELLHASSALETICREWEESK